MHYSSFCDRLISLSAVSSKFTCVVTCCRVPFLKVTQYSMVCTHRIFFIRSSVNAHLGRFRIWATVNSAASDVGMQASLEVLISALLGKYPKVRLQDHVVVLFLVF